MALPPTPSADSWPDEILAEARKEFWSTIEVYTPGTKGVYDPKAGTRAPGAPDTIHIAARPARIQHSGRLAQEQAGAAEWGVKRRYDFQIEMMPDDPLLVDGMWVRALNSPRQPQLERLSFQVTAATNSDHAALLTIRTVTEVRAVNDG